jgi:hypothetical protein
VRNLRPLDVVLAAVRVGEADYPRRCIVIHVGRDAVVLAPCSSKFDLYRDGRDFPIYDDDPGFAATRLARSSYVIENEETPWVELDLVRKRYGRLSGDLARRFCEWYGADLV